MFTRRSWMLPATFTLVVILRWSEMWLPAELPSGTEPLGQHLVRGSGWASSVIPRLTWPAWRHRATTSMWEGTSPPQAACPLPTLPNGMGEIGRGWILEWWAVLTGTTLRLPRLMSLHWPCRAAIYMQPATSRMPAGRQPIPSPNGTGAVGRRLARAWAPVGRCLGNQSYVRWRCREAPYMPAAGSRPRAAPGPITSPNGTGTVGPPWASGWMQV